MRTRPFFRERLGQEVSGRENRPAFYTVFVVLTSLLSLSSVLSPPFPSSHLFTRLPFSRYSSYLVSIYGPSPSFLYLPSSLLASSSSHHRHHENSIISPFLQTSIVFSLHLLYISAITNVSATESQKCLDKLSTTGLLGWASNRHSVQIVASCVSKLPVVYLIRIFFFFSGGGRI